MPSDAYTASVDHAFFFPLDGLAAASPHALACPEFADDAFIRLGIQRVLEFSPSGRGFFHDPRHDGVKRAVGHFYGPDTRTHTLRHLAAAEGLRKGVLKGTRVIIVHDKAGIDFDCWDRCRRECARFFISRVKENRVYDWNEDKPTDATAACDHGGVADRRIGTREGHLLRIVRHTDPVGGESREFLTHVMDLPAGVVAELCRRRWEDEKVFDAIKNRLTEKKAWAGSLTGKETQAQRIVLTHNLLLYGQRLENEHGITHRAEDLRREQRTDPAAKLCAMKGLVLPALVQAARRASQQSLKPVRWLRRSLREKLTEHAALFHLRTLYASS